jgi:RimJ/RimL family protein N-acetyltransferase
MYIIADDIKLVSTTDDDKDLVSLSENYEVLRFMSESRLHAKPMPSAMIFRLEHNNSLIGEASFKTIKWINRKAELSILIIPEFQRRGIGYKVLCRLLEFAFNTLNFYRLEAEIIEGNHASIQLFSKLGFVQEGILRKAKYIDGVYYDIIRLGLLKDEYMAPNQL